MSIAAHAYSDIDLIPAKYKTVGIVGGMGPEATADLFRWLIWLTPAENDQENIPIIINNNPQIPSRVEAILNEGPSPVPAMKKMCKMLEADGCKMLTIPCNVAHFYIKSLQKSVDIPIINMINETVDFVMEKHPNVKKVGLLAPEMTIRTALYQKALLSKKIECVLHEEHFELVTAIMNKVKTFRYHNTLGLRKDDGQLKVSTIARDSNEFDVISPNLDKLNKTLTKSIYGEKGIKAGYRAQPRKLMIQAANDLKKKGAEIIIMGCTEIPLILRQKDLPKTPLINPTEILAKAAVDFSIGARKFPKK